jgi:hypothetical protein
MNASQTVVTTDDLAPELPLQRYTVTIHADATWAQRALAHNRSNRAKKDDAILRYRRDMLAGKWVPTGETIKFDTAGNLIDGQNRCFALAELDEVTVEFDVTYNVSAKAQFAMDGGVKRTTGDQLGFAGFERPTKVGPVAKLMMSFEAGLLKSSIQKGIGSFTNHEVIEYLNRNPDVVEATRDSLNFTRRLPMAPSVIGFVLCSLRRIDRVRADDFMDALANMRTSGAGDPKYTLLRRLNAAKEKGENLSQAEQSHYVFRAWNAHRACQKLSSLKAANAHGAFDFQVPT